MSAIMSVLTCDVCGGSLSIDAGGKTATCDCCGMKHSMERMREKLAGLQQEQRERQAGAAWMEHYRIVRGNPVRTYEGEKFILKKRQ